MHCVLLAEDRILAWHVLSRVQYYTQRERGCGVKTRSEYEQGSTGNLVGLFLGQSKMCAVLVVGVFRQRNVAPQVRSQEGISLGELRGNQR